MAKSEITFKITFKWWLNPYLKLIKVYYTILHILGFKIKPTIGQIAAVCLSAMVLEQEKY